MKIKDLLAMIGIKLEDDVDISTPTTSELDKVEINDSVTEDSKTEEVIDLDNKEEVKDNVDKTEEVKAYAEQVVIVPEYDETTGLFNLENIKDESLKAVLQLSNDTVVRTANKVLIDNAMNTKLNSVKLAKNISTDAVLKLLDTSNVKVEDGKVIGLDEAFDNLKTSNGGLFTTEEESTPVLDGFSPIQKGNANAHIPSSFSDAFAMMEGLV